MADASVGVAPAPLRVCGMQAMTDIIGSIQNSAIRKLIIELSNFTDGPMLHPCIYMSLGQVLDPPPPTASAKEMVAFSFIKNAYVAYGVYGIIIYHLYDVNKDDPCALAILFSVPYSRTTHVNTFTISVLRHYEHMSIEKIFQTMSEKMETATGSEFSVEDFGYVVRATMSETATATMKVEISKKSKMEVNHCRMKWFMKFPRPFCCYCVFWFFLACLLLVFFLRL